MGEYFNSKSKLKGLAAGVLCAAFLSACAASSSHLEPLPRNVEMSETHNIYDKAVDRFKSSYPDVPVKYIDRESYLTADDFIASVKNSYKNSWSNELLSERFESKGGALLHYALDSNSSNRGCLVFPSDPSASAEDIIEAITDDRSLIPYLPKENKEYLEHEIFYHELAHCLLITKDKKPKGEYSAEALADAFAIAMHISDYGLETEFPQRFSAYRELVTLNRVRLVGEYGSFAAGLSYATHESIRAIYDDAVKNPDKYIGASLDEIYDRILDVAGQHQWSHQKSLRFNAVAKTIEQAVIEFNNTNATDYTQFGDLPYEDREQILFNILKKSPQASEFIDGYMDARLDLQCPPTVINKDQKLKL